MSSLREQNFPEKSLEDVKKDVKYISRKPYQGGVML